MSDLGFNNRAEMMNFIRQNLRIDSSTLGKGVVTDVNVKSRSLIGYDVLATESVGSGEIITGGVGTSELASNAVTASKLFVPYARVSGPAMAIPKLVATTYNLFNSAAQNAFEDGSVFFTGAAPDRVTVRRLGVYDVNVNWGWAAAVGDTRGLYVSINGVLYWNDWRPADINGNAAGSWSIKGLPLNAGDYFQFAFYQGAAVTLNVAPEVQIHFVTN